MGAGGLARQATYTCVLQRDLITMLVLHLTSADQELGSCADLKFLTSGRVQKEGCISYEFSCISKTQLMAYKDAKCQIIRVISELWKGIGCALLDDRSQRQTVWENTNPKSNWRCMSKAMRFAILAKVQASVV
jgi:hypothetical protein